MTPEQETQLAQLVAALPKFAQVLQQHAQANVHLAETLRGLEARMDALEAATPAPKPKRKRKKPNREDYDAVAAMGDSKPSDIADATGIPASTVRRYQKMTDAERDELPYLEPHFRDDDGNIIPDQQASEPTQPPTEFYDEVAESGYQV